MIHWPSLLRLLGYFILGLAASLQVTLGVALFLQDGGMVPLAAAATVATAAGVVLILAFRPLPHELTRREGIFFVVLAWLVASTLGALPFYLSDSFTSVVDALFESVSGFTTTGATVLADIEGLPASLHFWRSLIQWLGGMGIILLGIAILPLLGTGGMELYRAEFSGARSEKLKPRIAESALALWKIYVFFTLAEYLALRLAGLGPFDSLCHSFTTMATGGFSTRNASIEAFSSPAVEYIVVFFMLVAGINFTQHYRILVERQPGVILRDLETRSYLAITAAGTLVIYLSLLGSGSCAEETFRQSLFQVVSILTTTGYSSADFELWSSFGQLVLLALMFIGGCTGSTAGGLKVSRFVLLLNVVRREFQQMAEKRGVFAVRLGGRPVGEETIRSLLSLVHLAFLINFASCLLLTAVGVDVLTAISAVAASMFNIGPGLGGVGPTEHYGHLPSLAKWVLSFCMLAGRLEFYTLLVILTPAFWRK